MPRNRRISGVGVLLPAVTLGSSGLRPPFVNRWPTHLIEAEFIIIRTQLQIEFLRSLQYFLNIGIIFHCSFAHTSLHPRLQHKGNHQTVLPPHAGRPMMWKWFQVACAETWTSQKECWMWWAATVRNLAQYARNCPLYQEWRTCWTGHAQGVTLMVTRDGVIFFWAHVYCIDAHADDAIFLLCSYHLQNPFGQQGHGCDRFNFNQPIEFSFVTLFRCKGYLTRLSNNRSKVGSSLILYTTGKLSSPPSNLCK